MPPFAPGSLDTFRFTDSFLDFARLGEFTVITDGKERMRLHEPFENRIIPLDHIKPGGTAIFTISETIVASPQLGLAPGVYFYCVTNLSNAQHVEIESQALKLGSVQIDASSPSNRRTVDIDLRAITRIWSEATHLAIYRSKVVAVGDNDPFPTYARIGTVSVPTLTQSPFTAFVDSTPDDDLDFANKALNIFVGPPPVAPYIAELKNRLFATGFEAIEVTGAQLVNGSPVVNVPTDQLDQLHIGSQITFGTGERAYLIKDLIEAENRTEHPSPVSPPTLDRVVLGDEKDNDVNYEGTTGTKNLIVCFDPTLVRFSEPGKPYDWPPANNFSVGQGHGRNTMIGAARNTLIVGKRTETWAFRYNVFPSNGTDFQLSGIIGSVSQRTFSLDENGVARWLAAHGIAQFDGQTIGIISRPIAEKFRDVVFDTARGDLALRATAAHDIERHQYLCAIPTALATKGIGSRELLVYHYLPDQRAWSIFETQVEITAMTQDRDDAGYPAVIMGTRLGHVITWGVGSTDLVGVPGNTGTVKGTVDTYESSPDPRFLDNSALFFRESTSPKLGIIGAAVEIFAGTGAGQLSRIVRQDVSPEFIYLEDKLANRLDNTSQYRIGAIKAQHFSPWIDFGTNRTKYLEMIQVSYYIEPISPVGSWVLEIALDQPGVAAPVVAQGGLGRDNTRNNLSFLFKTDGSDEEVARGKSAQAAIGLRQFKCGNVSFIRMQWRLTSDDPSTPGVIISVTPILRPDEEPSP